MLSFLPTFGVQVGFRMPEGEGREQVSQRESMPGTDIGYLERVQPNAPSSYQWVSQKLIMKIRNVVQSFYWRGHVFILKGLGTRGSGPWITKVTSRSYK